MHRASQCPVKRFRSLVGPFTPPGRGTIDSRAAKIELAAHSVRFVTATQRMLVLHRDRKTLYVALGDAKRKYRNSIQSGDEPISLAK